MGNIAGARLEHRRSAVGARLERGWSAEGAQTECCWWRSQSEVSSVDGARLVAQTERGQCAVRAGSVRGRSAVRAGSVRGQSAVETRSGRSGMDEKNCRGGGAPAII